MSRIHQGLNAYNEVSVMFEIGNFYFEAKLIKLYA